jgi:hypothetical protein
VRAWDVVDVSGTATRQVGFHAQETLRHHLVALVLELERQGVRTSQTELLNAILAAGPATAEDARALLRE